LIAVGNGADALVVALVAVSIVKPWGGAGLAQPEPARASQVPAGAIAPVPTSSPPGPAETAEATTGAGPGPLAPGQVACGPADWRIVTLGAFGHWTVRAWIAITPVEADGPGDSSIPDLALGESDVAGLGACAPSARAGGPGRASRIVAAWRMSADGATTSTFGRVTLAELDPLRSGGPAGTRLLALRGVAELVRPVPAAQGGRWPAGRYVPAPGLARRGSGSLDRRRYRRRGEVTGRRVRDRPAPLRPIGRELATSQCDRRRPGWFAGGS
jgi:hypothetical protein